MGSPRLYLAEYPMYGRNEVAREGEDLDFRAADVRRLTEVERGGYEARPDVENVESQKAEEAVNKPNRRTSKGNSRMIGFGPIRPRNQRSPFRCKQYCRLAILHFLRILVLAQDDL